MRLAYDELLANQLALLLIRRQMRQARKGRPLQATGKLKAKAIAALPFALTDAQLQAIAEIESDIHAPTRSMLTDPTSCASSAFSRSTTSFVASRATSASTTSPGGLMLAPGNRVRLLTAGSSARAATTSSARDAGTEILRCITAPASRTAAGKPRCDRRPRR